MVCVCIFLCNYFKKKLSLVACNPIVKRNVIDRANQIRQFTSKRRLSLLYFILQQKKQSLQGNWFRRRDLQQFICIITLFTDFRSLQLQDVLTLIYVYWIVIVISYSLLRGSLPLSYDLLVCFLLFFNIIQIELTEETFPENIPCSQLFLIISDLEK